MNPMKSTRIVRPVLALIVAVGLSACASVDTASRNAPIAASLNAPLDAGTAAAVAPSETYKVTAINVTVPETLRVSEANRYYPSGDIVWREDPIGNRYQQVADIMRAGLERGVARVGGERPVILDVTVARFHALTEKARYTIGGVHAIQFDISLRDAESGSLIMPPRRIKADFDALGGAAAIAAESRGVTQKVRITNQLARVIQDELTRSDGYQQQATGLIGAINQL